MATPSFGRWPDPMSALGQKRTFALQKVMSASCQKQTLAYYSISSSTRASSVGGTEIPSFLEVLRLTTN